MIELNPLEVLQERKVNVLAPHFAKHSLHTSSKRDVQAVQEWILDKLNGRFCVVKYPAMDSTDKLSSNTYVGFEDQKELTYFMLACPHLRRN
jgi:hypothetical protein